MDTERELALEAYINQCERAVELQAIGIQDGKMKAGRWYYDFNSKKDIWAPYQCDLQAMVGDCGGDMGEPVEEQRWLALVMSELFSKRWTGEDWV